MKLNSTMIIAAVVIVLVVAVGAYAMSKSNNQKMMNKNEAVQKEGGDEKMNNNSEGVMVGGALMVPNRDIVDNAVNASNVTTVVAAVKAAGLVETLKSAGPFTVFAPTNDAFSKLPTGTVDTLLKPENKAKLASILTYHVVAGKYKMADITDGLKLKTVNGEELTFNVKDGKVWINNSAMIETADVISSNGVTHVIDTVLMPSAK